jgi:hypothetical protein
MFGNLSFVSTVLCFRAASLPPGRNYFQKFVFLLINNPVLRGSFAATGEKLFSEICFFLSTILCFGTASLPPGRNYFQFALLNQQSCASGQLRCHWGETVFRNLFFINSPVLRGSFAATGEKLFSEICFVSAVLCFGAASLPLGRNHASELRPFFVSAKTLKTFENLRNSTKISKKTHTPPPE